MNALNQTSLKSAYGPVPAGLESRTRETLAGLPDSGAMPDPARRGKRRMLALAAALALLAIGTALAVTLRPLLTRRLHLAEAADIMVQVPDPASASAVTDMAVFTVDAYLFDGMSLMADVRVVPNRSGIWILPDQYETYLDHSAGNLGVEETSMSIREYAASQGISQIRFVHITADTAGEDAQHLWIPAQPFLGEDGLIHLLLTRNLSYEARQELDLSLRFRVLFDAQPREDTVALHLTAAEEPQEQSQPVAVDVLGVTIQQMDLIRTPAITYCRMIYTYTPTVNRRGNIAFFFRNPDGRLIESPLPQGGTFDFETGTGVFLAAVPSGAEENGILSFRVLADGQFSDPISVAVPPAHP